MKKNKMNIIIFFALLLFTGSCKDDDTGGGNTDGEPSCDETLRPIVFVHGFLGSGDTYELQMQRFSSNGYCNENLYAFDWNSIAFGSDATGELDAFIDKVLQETGFQKVDLAGHSAGSGTGYDYLSDPVRAAKVEHYAHLGGSPTDGPAGPNKEIPTLNIWSTADEVVAGGDIPEATNVMRTEQDHYEVATSVETFEEMFRFFNDLAPASNTIRSQESIEVEGRVLTFGENIPMENARVNIYELESATGQRKNNNPTATANADVEGRYGPLTLRSETHYEFEVIPADGSRIVHYYREPFIRSSQLVYLRTVPAGGLGGVLLGSLPEDDNQTVLAFYAGSRAVINGRDVLTVDGNTLSTPEFTSPANSTIAMFYYDGNNNQTSDLTDIGGTWGLVPTFLAAVDMYIPTVNERSITIQLNGRTLVVPNLKSGTEGAIVAQFY